MHVFDILFADRNNTCVEGIKRKITGVVCIELEGFGFEFRLYAKLIIIILYI